MSFTFTENDLEAIKEIVVKLENMDTDVSDLLTLRTEIIDTSNDVVLGTIGFDHEGTFGFKIE